MSTLRDLLAPSRLTHVVDVGAKAGHGDPPYQPMLTQGLCHVTGFEPQSHALADLLSKCGPNENYLPYAVGDGGEHTLNLCRSDGMTSLLTPIPQNLGLLGNLGMCAEIVERVPLQTQRLDDIDEIEHLDFLKIDIQGGELAAFQNGRAKLAECVAIQTEVSFAPGYENQPSLGDIDVELRSQGFIPHCFAEIHKQPIAPARMPLNQIFDADLVYVRDFFRPDAMSDEQLKHLALIAHYCYKSFDLAIRCVQLLEDRGAVEAGTMRRYTSEPTAGPTATPVPAAPERQLSAAEVVADAQQSTDDPHSIFALAQQHFDDDDFTEATKLYLRRIAMGGDEQEIYLSTYRMAESMAALGQPWEIVQDVYLRAYKARPTRAEPLYAVARHLLDEGNYEKAHALAVRAAEIPLPTEDLLVDEDVYAWGVLDVQAACAPFVLPLTEAFTLWGRLLAQPDLPDDERAAIVAKRSTWVPALVEAASAYPQEVVGELASGLPDAEVTVSLIAGADRAVTEQLLNSFLHCCTDVSRVGRFLVADAGLSAADRAVLEGRYKFAEFIDCDPAAGSGALLAAISAQVRGRFWLHLGQGWQFFAPENLITRLTGVLVAEPQVAQVGVNFADADSATGTCATGESVRHTPDAGRYVLVDAVVTGPAMFDTGRLDQAGAAGMLTASLDEVFCIAGAQTRVQHPQFGTAGEVTDLAPMRFAVVSPEPDGLHSFDDVAETLHHALLALGHDSVMTKSLDLGDLDGRCPILLNASYIARSGMDLPSNTIIYNFEQTQADSPLLTPALFDLFLRFPVWDHSQANIDRLASWGIPRLTYVPVGYVPEMTRIVSAPKDVDVLFYGRTDDRRTALLDRLRTRGLRVEALSGVYGAERDAWIARSKVVLNVHAERRVTPAFEIVRVCHLLANRCVVVSEGGLSLDDLRGLESAIAFADYDELVDRCVELVGDEQARLEMAERGFQVFSARSEADILRQALSATLGVRDGSDDDKPQSRAVLSAVSPDVVHRESVESAGTPQLPVNDGAVEAQSTFKQAQNYFEQGDFAAARTWYERRIAMGGADEEVYFATYRLAASMVEYGEPREDVEKVCKLANQLRPDRAEPLYVLARRYRQDRKYQEGYLLAKNAAEMPVPAEGLLIDADIYAWRALDEQTACAYQFFPQPQVFALQQQLLSRSDIPDADRRRIAAQRDTCVPTMLEVASSYPDAVVGSLAVGRPDAEVTVSLLADGDRSVTEQTLNSFLNCCADIARVGRFIVADTGLSADDRDLLQQRYPFVEFIGPDSADEPDALLASIRAQVGGRFWLHLGAGWRFFAPSDLVTRLIAVLDAEPQALQVGVNLADASAVTGECAVGDAVHHAPGAARYLLADALATGPAMFDTERLDRAGGIDAIPTVGEQGATNDLRAATLDDVFCVGAVGGGRRRAQGTRVTHLAPRLETDSIRGTETTVPTRFAVVHPQLRRTGALREAAETVHYGLLSLGHDSVLTSRLTDVDGRRTIMLGAHELAMNGLRPPDNAILYNFEQVHADTPVMTPAVVDLYRQHPVWEYSQANIRRLSAWDVPQLIHVPVGYVPELTRIIPATEDIDVLFYGSMDERRHDILQRLQARGLRVKALFGAYGAERDSWVARSKVVINVHCSFYRAHVFEIARVSYLLANRRAVVSERGSNPDDVQGLESCIAFAEYDELVDRCVELVNDDQARHELAERGHQTFAAISEADILRDALSAIFGQTSTATPGVTA